MQHICSAIFLLVLFFIPPLAGMEKEETAHKNTMLSCLDSLNNKHSYALSSAVASKIDYVQTAHSAF